MGKQVELLDLQEIDSELDRLKRQREEIPERVEADEIGHELRKLSAVLAALEDELHEADRVQGRLESEVSTLGDKISREEKKLYGGSVANPKELGSIQEEVRLLDRQRDELETSLLEAMEAVEESRSKVTDAERRKREMQEQLAQKERAYSEKAAELDGEIGKREKMRAAAGGKTDPELLALYDKIRQQKGGVAVGEVRDGICGACRVELPAEELDRMLHTDSLWRCPQCRRILVER